ncbi:MAG: class I SAM-dependent methyltransferase [Deltaproteobacteria bacterium]|nr:class I SAM-dependent methyltransferase [Deltaproteobacteria bacterium]
MKRRTCSIGGILLFGFGVLVFNNSWAQFPELEKSKKQKNQITLPEFFESDMIRLAQSEYVFFQGTTDDGINVTHEAHYPNFLIFQTLGLPELIAPSVRKHLDLGIHGEVESVMASKSLYRELSTKVTPAYLKSNKINILSIAEGLSGVVPYLVGMLEDTTGSMVKAVDLVYQDDIFSQMNLSRFWLGMKKQFTSYRAHYEYDDATTLEKFGDNSTAMILSHKLFPHMNTQGQIKMIRQALRVLKPGGSIHFDGEINRTEWSNDTKGNDDLVVINEDNFSIHPNWADRLRAMSEALGFDYEVSVTELHCKPKITDQNSAKNYREIASDLFFTALGEDAYTFEYGKMVDYALEADVREVIDVFDKYYSMYDSLFSSISPLARIGFQTVSNRFKGPLLASQLDEDAIREDYESSKIFLSYICDGYDGRIVSSLIIQKNTLNK